MKRRGASPHPTLRLSDISFLRRRRSFKLISLAHKLHLTYNARGAFYQLLRSLPAEKGRKVLLPAFHCTALVEPAAQAGFAVGFYRICSDFSPDFDDIRSKMSPDVAVLLAVHYFGFPVELQRFLEVARLNDSYLVEDCAHSFLTRHGGKRIGHQGDFALFSYYKFAPSIAGGGLQINFNDFSGKVLAKRSVPFRDQIVLAKRLFEQILENAPEHPLSRILLAMDRRRVAEKRAVKSPRASVSEFVDDPYLFRADLALANMPRLCRFVLESCNWEEMISIRQRNYRLLGKLIRGTKLLRPVFPVLPDNVCPWAFPLLLEDRRVHEQELRALGVPLYTFGEVSHPLLGTVPKDQARVDAEYLSQRLLLLPVHSQISEVDIQQFAGTLNRYIDDIAATSRLEEPVTSTEKTCESPAI